ncbi:hypothetical protein D0962_22635 [Leptolyngbyaceae cyanobacterium CCMR0082]|uniref:Uncharacterized protein n=1 Tax=Adonisia turfae CCMR0082 TaxID=2304604 RepID=A0A6M0SAJ9_9CYAN|nr:hypothetical protein [Adonisia turfae]NEZ65525.1 hypothetical protein [Adonisia turfae CCMR0082]
MTIVYYKPHLDNPPRTGVLRLDSVKLEPTPKGGVPVVNNLTDELLAILQAHPSYQRRISSGAIVLPASASEKIEPDQIDYSSLDDLSGFNIEGDKDNVGAEDIVAATSDLDVLSRWLEAEARKTLQAIIEARIEELVE